MVETVIFIIGETVGDALSRLEVYADQESATDYRNDSDNVYGVRVSFRESDVEKVFNAELDDIV